MATGGSRLVSWQDRKVTQKRWLCLGGPAGSLTSGPGAGTQREHPHTHPTAARLLGRPASFPGTWETPAGDYLLPTLTPETDTGLPCPKTGSHPRAWASQAELSPAS